MQPMIGITTGGRIESDYANKYYDAYFSVPTLYIEAVRRAGGVPLLLPPGELHRERILNTLDGIIFSGGADVQPSLYQGDASHPALTKHDHERDEQEIALIRMLVQRPEIPVLCICRGMQVMNVALGGSLYEHIPDIRQQDMHRGAEGIWTLHDIQVEHSLLQQVIKTSSIHTWSGHHQAVNAIAPDLRVAAAAPDGIIEALEHRQHPWMIGVQWHPEKSAGQDPSQQAIFDGLVQTALTKSAIYPS